MRRLVVCQQVAGAGTRVPMSGTAIAANGWCNRSSAAPPGLQGPAVGFKEPIAKRLLESDGCWDKMSAFQHFHILENCVIAACPSQPQSNAQIKARISGCALMRALSCPESARVSPESARVKCTD